MKTTNVEAPYGQLSVGIDIGTTTVSTVVYDIDNKKQLEAYSLPHNSYIYSGVRSEQSVTTILDISENLLYRILGTYKNVVSIGVTGQMHGIVYVDSDGKAVSNLINWQDKRADQILGDGKTVCQKIYDITGENISTGYGIATHYCNLLFGKAPENAARICSIMDLFCMRICKAKKTVTHSSVASSFGLFDIEKGVFKLKELALIGINGDILPQVTTESVTVGVCNGIPVSVPLGDNQASFLGSVSNNGESVLVNIGTGSQVSAVSDYRRTDGDIELRPFIEGKYLICGSALCGGYAYSMLESFFRSYAVSAGLPDAPQYEIMNRLASEAYENNKKCLDVDVSFLGKRRDPEYRGSVKNIDRQNFTPSALILGVLNGMCNELYELCDGFREGKTRVVASGGAVRKNQVLKKLIADRFDMTVSLSSAKEEASLGAALFSALAVGKIKYVNGFSEYITYE